MQKKLPVKNILIQAFILPFENYKLILRLTWPYIIMTILLSTIFKPVEENLTSIDFLAILVSFPIIILSYVSCHRVFLLSKVNRTNYSTFKWTKSNTMYLAKFIKLTLFLMAIFIPILIIISMFLFPLIENSSNFDFFIVILMLPFMYFLSRYSLILPCSAVSNNHTFSWSWKISKNNHVRLFFLIGIIPILTSSVFSMLNDYYEASSIFSIINSLVWLIVYLIELCILSLCYKFLHPNYLENESVIIELKEKEDFHTIINQTDTTFSISFQENESISFDKLKTELYNYYEKLDFTNIILDKEESWMIKKNNQSNAYILL